MMSGPPRKLRARRCLQKPMQSPQHPTPPTLTPTPTPRASTPTMTVTTTVTMTRAQSATASHRCRPVPGQPAQAWSLVLSGRCARLQLRAWPPWQRLPGTIALHEGLSSRALSVPCWATVPHEGLSSSALSLSEGTLRATVAVHPTVYYEPIQMPLGLG